MKLYFWGADKEVTGSCHCVEVNGKKVLVDCGLQQGSDVKENESFPFAVADIDAVVVTHAHIDHSGRLPLLVKKGYKGPIYATRMTCELLKIMLLDSAHIQEADVAWKRRKEKRAGKKPHEPLYTAADAQATLELLHPVEYEQTVQVVRGLVAEFIDAGHLLGSAYIKMYLSENKEGRTIVFSGDIGNVGKPILKDPKMVKEADYVVMESTYGDRMHEKEHYSIEDFAFILDATLARGGNVVIPAFAVGRTQELLYFLREIKERKLVRRTPEFEVYLDSPLALEATQIYSGDLTGYADDEMVELVKKGFSPLHFKGLNLCSTVEESMALNEDERPKVIISASGMCEAGRIRHHLKHNLWRKECSVIFAGYQAVGTLGRLILDGLKNVKLFGEEIAVKAEIYNFRGLSAHADRQGLYNWIRAYETPLKKVFVVHGEEQAANSFAQLLKEENIAALIPDYKAIYDLATNRMVDKGIEREKVLRRARTMQKASPAYARLILAGESLAEVIRRNEGGSNKEIAKFADQILALAEKWDMGKRTKD